MCLLGLRYIYTVASVWQVSRPACVGRLGKIAYTASRVRYLYSHVMCRVGLLRAVGKLRVERVPGKSD